MRISQERLNELGYEKGTRTEGTYSARMELGEQLPVPEIIKRLGKIVVIAANNGENWPISGFIPAHPTQEADSVLFASDPNRYGNPSPEECAIIVPKVVDVYEATHGPVELRPEPVTEHFRTLPGLVKGYGTESYEFTVDEALDKLPEAIRTDSGLTVVGGTVWSARFRRPDQDSYYYEPGFDLRGSESAIPPTIEMANEMSQDRIVFEITDSETQVIQRPRGA